MSAASETNPVPTTPTPLQEHIPMPKWVVYAIIGAMFGGPAISGGTASLIRSGGPDPVTRDQVMLALEEHSHTPHDGIDLLLDKTKTEAVAEAVEACRVDRGRDLRSLKDGMKRIEATVDRLEEELLKKGRRR